MASRGRPKQPASAQPAPAPADLRRSTRNTRDTIVAANPATTGAGGEADPDKSIQNQPGNVLVSKLAVLEPARRGAKPRDTRSLASSIATRPWQEGSDRDNFDDEEQEEIADSAAGSPRGNNMPSASRIPSELVVSQSQDKERPDTDVVKQAMALSLGDLLKSSQDLMELLKIPGRQDPVLARRLRARRVAFTVTREIYEEGQGAEENDPLLDVTAISEYLPSPDPSIETSMVLEHANLTTALDVTEMIRAGEFDDIGPLFEAFDNLTLFFPYGAANIQGSETLHLAIRTHYTIESLANMPPKSDPYFVVATIFGDTTDISDRPSLLENGPYRNLVNLPQSHTHSLCRDRVHDIVSIIESNMGDFGVEKLRARFPLVDLLDDLRGWILTTYTTSEARIREPDTPSVGRHEEALMDADEELTDSLAGSDSQPIVRLSDSQNIPSLYHGPESRRFLDNQARASSHTAPPADAPQDYPEHSNEQLLSRHPLPPARALETRLKRKYFDPVTISDDDDDDDVFETDTRPVNTTARERFPSMQPTTKRQRALYTEKRPASTDKLPMDPPPVPSRSRAPAPDNPFESTQLSSTQADFDALNSRKKALAQEARRYIGPSTGARQRHAWDPEDCSTLIDLIHERQARWADIERYDSGRFKLPRNQQAYRDKARNMKVDFLLLDVVLPPSFNLVALSNKEIKRVLGLGKNPYRKEEDLDENGDPVNTEYDPALYE